jgi:hypothetical protein
MQAPGGVIDLVAELAAGMQRGEDHLQRRLVLEFRVRVDGDAAAVIANRHRLVGRQLQLDSAGVARHRLVHGVVEQLRHQMVQRPLVGATDVHCGAAPYRLQALENLDVLGGVVLPGRRCLLEKILHGGTLRCFCFVLKDYMVAKDYTVAPDHFVPIYCGDGETAIASSKPDGANLRSRRPPHGMTNRTQRG